MMMEMSIPRNLTSPKSFNFVRRLLEREGIYWITFLDTKETSRAYQWFQKHRNKIKFEPIKTESKD